LNFIARCNVPRADPKNNLSLSNTLWSLSGERNDGRKSLQYWQHFRRTAVLITSGIEIFFNHHISSFLLSDRNTEKSDNCNYHYQLSYSNVVGSHDNPSIFDVPFVPECSSRVVAQTVGVFRLVQLAFISDQCKHFNDVKVVSCEEFLKFDEDFSTWEFGGLRDLTNVINFLPSSDSDSKNVLKTYFVTSSSSLTKKSPVAVVCRIFIFQYEKAFQFIVTVFHVFLRLKTQRREFREVIPPLVYLFNLSIAYLNLINSQKSVSRSERLVVSQFLYNVLVHVFCIKIV
jgi:hypothetical protein